MEIPGLLRSEVKLAPLPFGDEVNLLNLQRIEPRFLGRAAPVTTVSRESCGCGPVLWLHCATELVPQEAGFGPFKILMCIQ